MNSSNRIVLNYLPPAESSYPSAALSILCGFMNQQNVSTKVIYWNILIKDLLSDIKV